MLKRPVNHNYKTILRKNSQSLHLYTMWNNEIIIYEEKKLNDKNIIKIILSFAKKNGNFIKYYDNNTIKQKNSSKIIYFTLLFCLKTIKNSFF